MNDNVFPAILIVFGVVFLFAAIFGSLPNEIKIKFLGVEFTISKPGRLPQNRQIPAAVAGLALIVAGIFFYVWNSNAARAQAQALSSQINATNVAAQLAASQAAQKVVLTEIAAAITPSATSIPVSASPSQTSTQLPTSTPYPTGEVVAATQSATETAVASASLTKLPSPSQSATPTNTETPDFQQTAVSALVMTNTAVVGKIATSISLSAVPTSPPGEFVADGFDSPVGTEDERASAKIWPGNWLDTTGYGTRYNVGSAPTYQTGATLVLNSPNWGAAAHQPVFAAGRGVVTFASKIPSSSWGNVIVIRHDPLAATGQVVYTRYAHVENLLVRAGDRVTRGQQIASVGNADGLLTYFLHFDISPTDILKSNPGDWPGANLSRVEDNYVDPRQFILVSRPQLTTQKSP